jgi:beta-lactamase class A
MIVRKNLLMLVAVLAAFAFGMMFDKKVAKNISPNYTEIRENSPSHKFTNPLLECNIGPNYLSNGQIKPSEAKLNSFIDDEVRKGHVSSASIYYRDLNNGPYVNINGGVRFLPASLMKVPIMMYFYKASEDSQALLDTKIMPEVLPKGISFDQYFQPEKTIDISKPHRVAELIDSMIRYSDNYAAEELNYSLKPGSMKELLNDLHIEIPDIQNAFITVKDYATFFRVLFNASYLNQSDSERALKLLSETTFDKGLVKYLPNNIVVSHKFGERTPDETGGFRQVHDCGVVYFPLHPYLLCVMTRGKDADAMAETIAQASRLVYSEINNQTK